MLVNDFIDVTMRTLELPRSVLGGLEWSVNEITDNVLNHSSSINGGFVQLRNERKITSPIRIIAWRPTGAE